MSPLPPLDSGFDCVAGAAGLVERVEPRHGLVRQLDVEDPQVLLDPVPVGRLGDHRDEQRVEQLVVVVFDLSGMTVHALVWLDQGLAVIGSPAP